LATAKKKASKESSYNKSKIRVCCRFNGTNDIDEIGQLNLPTSEISPGLLTGSNVAKNIEEGKVGGLFNIKSAEKIREVQKVPLKKPIKNSIAFFGMDVIHGYETTFLYR
jgi:beta-glucosidase